MDRGDRAVAVSDRPKVLIVAGSDSSGGAGIVRDVETVATIGVGACLAVTAVTAQTHADVLAIEPMPPALVADQMRAALRANHVGAVKVGMLATAGTAAAVAAALGEHADVPAVLDPVLESSSGKSLLEVDAIETLKRELVPLCRLVTPNWMELAVLTGSAPAAEETEALRQGGALLRLGCGAVLIKGGHAPGDRATDVLLCLDREPVRLDAPRYRVEMRGTGCMLASAIAAHLATGASLELSVERGKAFVLGALQAACGIS